MGFLDWIPFVESGIRGSQHVKHQLDYHPKFERKSGFFEKIGMGAKNLTQIVPEFFEGALGGAKMSGEDRKDTAF